MIDNRLKKIIKSNLIDLRRNLNKVAEEQMEFGPDDVILRKPMDNYPAGTKGTIMDMNGTKFVVQVDEDGQEILVPKSNLKRCDGQRLEYFGSNIHRLKKSSNIIKK